MPQVQRPRDRDPETPGVLLPPQGGALRVAVWDEQPRTPLRQDGPRVRGLAGGRRRRGPGQDPLERRPGRVQAEPERDPGEVPENGSRRRLRLPAQEPHPQRTRASYAGWTFLTMHTYRKKELCTTCTH